MCFVVFSILPVYFCHDENVHALSLREYVHLLLKILCFFLSHHHKTDIDGFCSDIQVWTSVVVVAGCGVSVGAILLGSAVLSITNGFGKNFNLKKDDLSVQQRSNNHNLDGKTKHMCVIFILKPSCTYM